MTAACGCDHREEQAGDPESGERAWWRDRALLVPLASGAFFLTGLVTETTAGESTAAGNTSHAMFWIGLLLGAYTFVPGALRSLFTRGKLGISLLMTISAAGAIALGFIEEAAALAFLYSIAEALEDRAMDKARSGLRSLLKLVPETAMLVQDGETLEVAAASITVGDTFLVLPGKRVATDGTISSGSSSVDASAITGESMPVDVSVGDQVAAGSINASGPLELVATANGTDNSITTLVNLVEQAQRERGRRARLADRIARPLVPGVMILAALVGTLGSLITGDPLIWVTRALVVLVAASPCALAIAVPVTVVSAIGAASRFGVIVKSGAAFEQLGSLRRIAFDKTGTLTRNQPSVVTVLAGEGVDHERVIEWAAALEQFSTHPLAAAITAAAPSTPPASDVTEQPGEGIAGVVAGQSIAAGSPRWIAPGELAAQVTAMEAEGQTCVLVARDGETVGVIGIRDELRPEAPTAVASLQDQGLEVIMLTGDNARTANVLAGAAGITDVRAELRPEDKAAEISASVAQRPTGMIGDGINDAPALATATVGIAMGVTGADAAIESADVALTGNDLRIIPRALNHARRGRAIMNQNIVLSLAIVTCLVPLAVTGVLGLAAVVLVHEVAEVVVIANGLRAAHVRRSQAGSDL
ncbi:cation-transporting ATPase G [Leucobacter komagatae]|uniref:Cation-transporting ATPase G n=1 Tax=Leucobacter komagatae TaxID=55969 RepID=A0A542Y5Q2_9MICO|nr:cation-translocating P-type ATPase [Leucobacter komagatae]TQL43383.1 cation-transporting ATPase G [Leucobacter komagatae]